MNLIDLLLVAIIAGYCVYVLYKHFIKNKGCSASCTGCVSAASCKKIDYKQIKNELKEDQ